MNPISRAAVESKHAEFLANVTGLPIASKVTLPFETRFEVANVVTVPGKGGVSLLRIRSIFNPREAQR